LPGTSRASLREGHKKEVQKFRSSGVQEEKSSGVQEERSFFELQTN
jgi:hypothetical protein